MPVPLPIALEQLLIKLVAINGVPLPSRPYLNLLGLVAAADNPNFTVNGQQFGSTDVTLGAVSIEALTPLTAPIAASALVSGVRYLVDTTAGAFTQPLPTSGMIVGTFYEFTDAKATFVPGGAKNLTVAGGTNSIVDPHFINVDGRLCVGNNLVLDQVRTTTRVTWTGSLWDCR
jgi:hypothetical protein